MPTPKSTTWPQLKEYLRASIDVGGHSFAYFADYLGTSRSYVVRIVRGNQVPSIDEAEAIAGALGYQLQLTPAALQWYNDPRNEYWSAFVGHREYRIEKEHTGGYSWALLSYTGRLEGVEVHYTRTMEEAKKECENHRRKAVRAN